MILFDFILLLLVSGVLATKSLYLGTITLVIGFLLGFQNIRTIHLLGQADPEVPTARKIKALILSCVLGVCAIPLLLEGREAGTFEKEWAPETVLPIIIVIGLFSAAMMAALTVEKRKR
jgi:hypothetical protein